MSKKNVWKTITITEKNKKELERIKRELEIFHDRDFRIDVAVSLVLQCYKGFKKIAKDKMTKFYKLKETNT